MSIEPYTLCDTTASIHALLDILAQAQTKQIYLDFEGVNLCKSGKMCIGQLLLHGSPHVYLLDITILGPLVFSTQKDGQSLSSIFRNTEWKKVMFDPKNDIDAMFHQFGVMPVNVICLQLADIARDRMNGEYRRLCNGLGKVLGMVLPYSTASGLKRIKEAGKKLFAPECGGSYAVFEERPLKPDLVAYCVGDVRCLETLYEKLVGPLSLVWMDWLSKESFKRTQACLKPGYSPKDRNHCLAPQ
jgi:exonuclease 3'-5' domain-containing protein 1